MADYTKKEAFAALDRLQSGQPTNWDCVGWDGDSRNQYGKECVLDAIMRSITERWWIVEIADEIDGFVSVFARSADEAEEMARDEGYDVLYAHAEDEF